MTKKRWLIALFCILLLLFSACSNHASNENPQDQTAANHEQEESQTEIGIQDIEKAFNEALRKTVDSLFDDRIEDAKNSGDNEMALSLSQMREDFYEDLVKKDLMSCTEEEFEEVWESEIILQSVRYSCPNIHPDITYKDAFENFFSNPEWSCFKGTKGNSDELIRIVEFTGGCLYDNEPVKALIQFEIEADGSSFKPS